MKNKFTTEIEYPSKHESQKSFMERLEKKLDKLHPEVTIKSINHTSNSDGNISSVLIIYDIPPHLVIYPPFYTKPI